MKSRLAILAFALLLAAPATYAGGYVGASFTSSETDIDAAVENFDPDDSGFKIYAGFTFVKFLAVEASYRDLGTFSDTNAAMDSVTADIEAFDVSARGIIGMPGPVSLFARAGYANISVDGSFDISGIVGQIDEDDWELFYGAGIDIKLPLKIGIRVEYETFDTDEDLDSISAGVFFRF